MKSSQWKYPADSESDLGISPIIQGTVEKCGTFFIF